MRTLLLAADESDFFDWHARHPEKRPDMVVWPGRFCKLDGAGVFIKLFVTAEAWYLDAAIAACLTRVKGTDGLTPGQRITADNAGQRMRDINASIARHPAGKQRPGTPRPPRMRPE